MPTLFPQPLVPATTNSAYNAADAAFYLVIGPGHVSAHPLQVTSPGRISPPLPPSYPIPSQVSHPAFPMPLGQADHVATIQVVPSLSPSGRNQDSLGGEKYEEEGGYRYPARRDGDGRAKSPPSRPFFAGTLRMTRSSQEQTPERQVRESRLARFFSAVFRMPFRRQTVQQHTVREPQLPTFPCRYPECLASVRGDVAARLGGFCGDTHMWMAIHEGIATHCPRCQQRVCPEGKNFCSAQCANGHA